MTNQVKNYNFKDYINYTRVIINAKMTKNNHHYSKEDILQDCFFVFEKAKNDFDLTRLKEDKLKRFPVKKLFRTFYRYRVYWEIQKILRKKVYPQLNNRSTIAVEKTKESDFRTGKIIVESNESEKNEKIKQTEMLDKLYDTLSKREITILYLRGVVNDKILKKVDVLKLPKPIKKWKDIDLYFGCCRGGSRTKYNRLVKKLFERKNSIVKDVLNKKIEKLKRKIKNESNNKIKKMLVKKANSLRSQNAE